MGRDVRGIEKDKSQRDYRGNIMKKKAVIIQDDEKPIEKKILAQALVDMSKSMKSLLASGLNRQAIVILIHDRSKIGKTHIEIVLNNLEALREDYTTLK